MSFPQKPHMSSDKEVLILDFTGRPTPWLSVDDGVMGGRSHSRFSFSNSNTAIFEGSVSLENNGGFASARTSVDPIDLSPFKELKVRVLGDGHVYQLRLRWDDTADGITYQARFPTSPNRWESITVPLSSFEPTYRGRRVGNAPPLMGSSIRQIGFMISDRQEGGFRLEIGSVCASVRYRA